MTDDAPTMADLLRRIRRLEDLEAIRALRDRYHSCINDGRYGEIRRLFAADAVVELGYLARYDGIDAIDRGFRAMGERVKFFIKQYIHGHLVEVTGDSGTGVSYLEARYGRQGVSYLVSGRYDDIYVRSGETWLFKSMVAEFYYTVPAGAGWMGDERHHLRPAGVIAASYISASSR